MLGCIRILKWNKEDVRPIQKLFNINPVDFVKEKKATFWHVGRFAIKSAGPISGVSLFKELMMCAITPICKTKNESYMLAECDKKLLQVMGKLGIETTRLGNGLYYLASETIPILSSKYGLRSFYQKHQYLVQTGNYTKV